MAVAAACLTPAARARDRIYWSTPTGYPAGIAFAGLDGTGGGYVDTHRASGMMGLALDPAAGRVYWANEATNKISFARLQGSGGGDLATGSATVYHPVGVAIDPAARRIYWADYGVSKISFARLDGSGGGDLPTGSATVSAPYGVALDRAAGRIYWANNYANNISFARLDGSGGGDLPTGAATVSGPTGVALDRAARRIYWANANTNKISFARLDGSGGGDLPTGTATVYGAIGVAIDPAARRIYWANAYANKLSFARLDGSGGRDLATGRTTVNDPYFVALLQVPRPASRPRLAGGSVAGATLRCSRGAWLRDAGAAFLYRAPRFVRLQWTRDGVRIRGATGSHYRARRAGAYRCRAVAVNAAGRAAQSSARHVVLPDTRIIRSTVGRRRASFAFHATGGVHSFQCALTRPGGRPRFRGCRSPRTYRRLRAGVYVFSVRAISRAGPDRTPAKRRFRI